MRAQGTCNIRKGGTVPDRLHSKCSKCYGSQNYYNVDSDREVCV